MDFFFSRALKISSFNFVAWTSFFSSFDFVAWTSLFRRMPGWVAQRLQRQGQQQLLPPLLHTHRHAYTGTHVQVCLCRHACTSVPPQARRFFVARFRRMDGGGVLLRRFSSYAHVAVAVAVAAATTAATAAVAASEYVAGRARCSSHGNSNQLVLLQLLQLLVRLLLFALLPTAAAVAKQQ